MGVTNVRFPENFAYVLNGWWPKYFDALEKNLKKLFEVLAQQRIASKSSKSYLPWKHVITFRGCIAMIRFDSLVFPIKLKATPKKSTSMIPDAYIHFESHIKDVFRTLPNIYDQGFSANSQRCDAVNCLCKKASS